VITAVLALWWLLDPHGPRHTTHTRSASLEVPARGGQPDATLSRGQEPTPGRSVATGTLQLWVETETTLPPNGVVRWVSTRDRPLWPPSLDSPHTEQDGVGTPVEQQELADGRARIAIPSSSWIWLSIRSSAGTAYRLVAPFTGNKELRVRIHPGRCGLHAWFVTADGAQPESNSSVRVMRRNPGTGRTEELLAEQLSQHPGYAHFENLIPSFFVVLSPGATIEDLPPQVAEACAQPGPVGRDLVCMMVMPPVRQRVDLEIRADFVPRRGLPPQLFFRSVGADASVYRARGLLRPGDSDSSVELPSGSFVPQILPLGILRVVSPSSVIVREAGVNPRVEVHIEQNRTETDVEILGLERQDFPVTVCPIEASVRQPAAPGVLFVGDHRWQAPKRKVLFPALRARLGIYGRAQAWLSRDVLQLGEPSLQVETMPASILQIHWAAPPSTAIASFRIRVSSGIEDMELGLERSVERVGDRARISLTGAILVPHGPVSVTCSDLAGKPIWHRSIACEGHRVALEIRDG
jgi:hypothetical protein